MYEESNELNAIILFGLPGSGKTTWIRKQNYINYEYISADDIRESLPEYDKNKPEEVHQKAVRIAEEKLFSCADVKRNLILDGGGINTKYTLNIVNHLKIRLYKITLVYIKTPIDICVQRNDMRIRKGERFVPTSEIYKKNLRLKNAFENLSIVCDNVITVSMFSNKYIFVDMDGCVAAYQTLPCNEDGNVNFVNRGIFRYAPPVQSMIDMLKTEKGSEIYVISASPNSFCSKEKIEWIKEYMPFVKEENIFFVGNKDYKIVMLLDLLHNLGIQKKDCILIDDWRVTIENGLRAGIRVMHPTYYMAMGL